MSKIKLIGIGIVVLFLASAVITTNVLRKQNIKLKADNYRLVKNQNQVMNENISIKNLRLKEIEINDRLRLERDSIAEALKIKPKQVERIIYITTTEIDTVVKNVPVYVVGQNFWKIKDSGKCFRWEADAFLLDDSLNVNRTLFDYHNKTTQTFYRERPKKFLFIRYGKWQYKQQIDSECGESKLNSFEFE